MNDSLLSSPRFAPVISEVERMLKRGETIYMAVDGRCASGKTTLSRLLRDAYDAAVIHMDDFFLPETLRTAERLAQPGGNVHYERFMDEVASGLKNGSAIEYRVFDCGIMDYNGTVRIHSPQFVVMEGSYSLRPEFRELYNLKVFSDISEAEQKRRIIERNGGDGYRAFRERWIPLEEHYFKATDTAECCDIVLTEK